MRKLTTVIRNLFLNSEMIKYNNKHIYLRIINTIEL